MVSGRLIIFNTLLKRLSDRITKSVNVTLTKNDGFKKPEKMALEGFSEKISQHLGSGAMADLEVMRLDAVLEPKISNVDVTRLRASRGTAIGGKTNGAFVVLFKDVASNGVTLGFHKVLDPNGVGHVITRTDRFGFSGAFGIDFLFSRFAKEGAAAKRDGATGVTAAIGVDSIRCVDPCA